MTLYQKAESWENQSILYAILAVLLWDRINWLAWIIAIYAVAFCAIPAFVAKQIYALRKKSESADLVKETRP